MIANHLSKATDDELQGILASRKEKAQPLRPKQPTSDPPGSKRKSRSHILMTPHSKPLSAPFPGMFGVLGPFDVHLLSLSSVASK